MAARVLLIDDSETMRMLVRRLLEARGHHVSEADTGERGLRLARLGLADIVVCDLQLPGMDGIELVRELRRHDDEQVAQTPVLILTGDEDSDTKVRALSAGATGMLYKPVDPDVLYQAIDEALDQ